MQPGSDDDSLVRMQLAVVLDHRFWVTPDGCVWTDGPFPYSFFTRYLDVFDRVLVVARIAQTDQAGQHWLRANGDDVGFATVPCYIGPWEYLKQRTAVRRSIKQALAAQQAIILRAPGQLANVAARLLLSAKRPYVAEIVGDPYDAFAPGADRRLLRPLFRWHQTRALRGLCQQAAGAAYVTEYALQSRYPPAHTAFTTHYSSVELRQNAFIEQPRVPKTSGPLRLITVGSMEHLYKGQDVPLHALAECRSGGLDIGLTLVGDGRERTWLEALAQRLGLGNAVHFVGQLPSGEAVRCELDRADLFILPSRQEGVPRAMIEAMARGLPCIGSTVGGIPELLPKPAMVPPGNIAALVAVFRRFSSAQTRRQASLRNLAAARAYEDRILRHRRRQFYEQTALQ